MKSRDICRSECPQGNGDQPRQEIPPHNVVLEWTVQSKARAVIPQTQSSGILYHIRVDMHVFVCCSCSPSEKVSQGLG
jgi:hypothetical protein